MFALNRITTNPQIMNGKPCIRGMRITVNVVLSLLAHGMTKKEIIEDYPYPEDEDIDQCLQYAGSKNLSQLFAGTFSAKGAEALQKHIRESRDE
jgi:uncharacterized protein (DUF433 family)